MRRKVKPIKKPKLHILDEVIYVLAIPFSIFAIFAAFGIASEIQGKAVAEYENIVAYSSQT